MFTLLPQEYKKKVLKEYTLRRIIVGTIFIVAIGIIASVILIPIYISGHIEAQQLTGRIDLLQKTSEDAGAQKASSEVVAIQSKLKMLGGNTSYVFMNDVLKVAIQQRGNSIKLTSFSYKKGDKDTSSRLSVSGVAVNRESLQEYGKRLESGDMFDTVDIPIGNFAQNKNIQFTINAEGSF